MKKILKGILQVILTIVWFVYVVLRRLVARLNPARRMKTVLSEEYRLAIFCLARKKVNRRFLNDSNEHGELVSRLILADTAESDEVFIYSKSLTPMFYRKVLLPSKCHIKILLDDKKGINIIKTLPKDVQSRLDCRLTSVQSGEHFLVSNDAFRYELKHRTNLVFGTIIQYELKNIEISDEL